MAGTINIKIHNNSGRIIHRLEDVVSTRMEYAATRLESKIKKKFKKSARFSGHSKPGEYPRSINRHALNSIHVFKTKHASGDVIRVGFKSGNKKYSKRIEGLSQDQQISPKGGKALAIPLTWEAKKFASDAKQSARDYRPGGQEMELLQTKGGNAYLATKTGTLRRMTGQKYKKHFLLIRKSVRRRARKGIFDAMREEEKWFVEYLTKGVRSELGDR
jgi:hypothetical protein